METRETQVNLTIMKKDNTNMTHHQKKIITNVQKSMKKFIEKVPKIHFPKE